MTVIVSRPQLDGMALDMGRRIAFIKAYGSFWATSLNLQKKGGTRSSIFWTRSTSVFRPNGKLRVGAFIRRRSRNGLKKEKKRSASQKQPEEGKLGVRRPRQL
jgi:hypothetical protein